MRKGKVQTTLNGVNVLVEHEDCSGRHYSYLDKEVLCQKMTDDEINLAFSKIELSLDDKKKFLTKIKGFAISDLYNKELGIDGKSLFKYKLAK